MPPDLEPVVPVTTAKSEEPEEPEDDAEQEDLVSEGPDEENCAYLLPIISSSLLAELNLEDISEEKVVDEESSISQSEETDGPGDLASEAAAALASEGGSTFQRSYIDGTLPDLLKGGRPLTRRRTVGHVSTTVGQLCC